MAERPKLNLNSQETEYLKEILSVLYEQTYIVSSEQFKSTEEHVVRRMLGIEIKQLFDIIHEKLGKFSPEQERHFNRAMAYAGEGHLIESKGKRGPKPDQLTAFITLTEIGAQTFESIINSTNSDMATSRRVFVVHGSAQQSKEACARFLLQLELEPVILHEQPNIGKTLVEKFEHYASVPYAIVLLTPDDIGGANNETTNEFKKRARQNVIFELGYFIGKLGRKGVCALYSKGVELPSDYHGVVYIEIDEGDAWKLLVARELRAAGFSIDLNRIV